MNKAVRLVNTRFVLVLDPDFYIVSEEWAARVINYMLEKDLAFLGAPWHPKWYYKLRYFPCGHCLFIDLARISKDELDFTPGQEINAQDSLPPFQLSTMLNGSSWDSMPPRVITALKAVSGFNARQAIGKSQDTGYNVYCRYGLDGKFGLECFIPVYRPEVDYQASPRWANQLLDKFLPDRWSYTPKRQGYYVRQGFREMGFVDVARYGWEEFIWQKKPFGFHLRGMVNRQHDAEKQLADLTSALTNLTGLQTRLDTSSPTDRHKKQDV